MKFAARAVRAVTLAAAALAAPDVRQRFLGLGVEPRPSTPDELQTIYDADVARWRKVITEARVEQQ